MIPQVTSHDVKLGSDASINKQLEELIKCAKTIAKCANAFLRMEYIYLGTFALGMALVIMVRLVGAE